MQVRLSVGCEDYVEAQIATGLYANAVEVVRAALQLHQDQMQENHLQNLRTAVAVGAEQAERGEFVEQTVDEIFAEAEKEYSGQI